MRKTYISESAMQAKFLLGLLAVKNLGLILFSDGRYVEVLPDSPFSTENFSRAQYKVEYKHFLDVQDKWSNLRVRGKQYDGQ